MSSAEITIEATNVLELNAKIQAIEKIKKLDVDTLNKLSQLASSQKAIDKLKSNWLMVKTMFL